MTFVLDRVLNVKSSHATRHETLVHSHFSSLSHCGLNLPYGVRLVRTTPLDLQKRAGFPQKSSCAKKRLPPLPSPPPPPPPPSQSYRLFLALLGLTVLSIGHCIFSGRTDTVNCQRTSAVLTYSVFTGILIHDLDYSIALSKGIAKAYGFIVRLLRK